MTDLRQAKHLLVMAEKDVKALRGMLNREVFEDEIFGFHVQQSAEKLLKAWLALLGRQYPHTHDLSLLLNCLLATGARADAYTGLIEYNSFAVQYRYDALDVADEPIDRQAALSTIETLLEGVRLSVEDVEKERGPAS